MATMSAPFLQPAAPEDTMELSSPGNRTLDEDIDIDFDGDFDATGSVGDEQMGDDAEQHDHPEQDEDMLPLEDNAHAAETTDQPRFSTIPDEDLIDYSDDDEEETTQPVTVLEQPQSPVTKDTSQTGQVTAATLDTTDAEIATQQQTATDSVLPETIIAPSEDDTSAVDPVVRSEEQSETVTAEEISILNATAPEFIPSAPDEHEDHAKNTVLEGDLKPRLSTTSFVPITEAPGTPTDTGLHPVTLYYADQEYALFRTRNLSDGLLKDDNLASISLADLIKACRQSLVIRTQQEIDESLEVILTFDDLALSVSEDAPAAFQISLKEVLDVYVQLQINDGHADHDIPPLSISCNLQIKFNKSIVVLRNAAGRGDGLTAVVPTHDEAQEDEYEGHVEDDHEDAAFDIEELAHEDDEAATGDQVHGEEHDVQNSQHDNAEPPTTNNEDDNENEAQIADEEEDEAASVTLDHVPTPSEQSAHDSISPHDQDHAEEATQSHSHTDTGEQDTAEPDASILQSSEVVESGDVAEELYPSHSDHEAAVGSEHAPTDESNLNDVPEPEQSTTLATEDADDDGAHSDFEFDLEDYDQPESHPTPSPSAKRPRDAADIADDGAASKKPRSS